MSRAARLLDLIQLLREGFVLPPLMFSAEELEAVVLGMRWVAQRGDRPLAEAARDALAKINAVLPPALQAALQSSALLVARLQPPASWRQREGIEPP